MKNGKIKNDSQKKSVNDFEEELKCREIKAEYGHEDYCGEYYIPDSVCMAVGQAIGESNPHEWTLRDVMVARHIWEAARNRPEAMVSPSCERMCEKKIALCDLAVRKLLLDFNMHDKYASMKIDPLKIRK